MKMKYPLVRRGAFCSEGIHSGKVIPSVVWTRKATKYDQKRLILKQIGVFEITSKAYL